MTDRNITVTITPETMFKAVLIGLLLILLYLFRDLLLVLLAAVVIASAVEPATRWFARYRVPRVLAVIFIYIVCIIFFLGILYFFIPPLISETLTALSLLSSFVETLEVPNPFTGGPETGSGLFEEFSLSFSLKEAATELRSIFSSISGGAIQTATAVFGGLFSFILILVFSFYLSVQERGIENFLRLIAPARHETYVVDLWKRTQMKIGRWMQGQLLLGLIVGVLVFLGLTILGVKHALLLAVLSAFFELIPLFGPILSAIPAAILGFTESIALGLMVIGLYVIIQQFENHLIYPLVVRKVVGVSPIIVIISLLMGAQLAGFLGILLAVPVAAAILEFTEDIQKGKRERKA